MSWILSSVGKGTKESLGFIASLMRAVKSGVKAKDTLGVAWLYTIGSVFWLIVLGTAAMNMRTYLVYNANSPDIGPIYYSALTLHGWSAMLGLVPNAAIAVIVYSMYKSDLQIRKVKAMTTIFWISNLLLAFALFGGPDMGWYMYPPLATEESPVFHAFLNYTSGALIGTAYLALAIESALQAVATVIIVGDAYATKKPGQKLNIFAAYGVAFAIVIALTLPALSASELWYALYFFLPGLVSVNPLLWVVLFWFYGHPVVYYVPFPLFGAMYYFIPRYTGRQLYSEKWARYNIYLLAVGSMLIWVHHLQTWPLPVSIRLWVNLSTLVLAAGSGLTVLNLGLTILLSKGYNYRDPVGMTFLIALIGFILGGVQAVPQPENLINGVIHNSYYIVGHFHLVIWTLILMGFTGVFLDMLKETAKGFEYSAKGSKLMVFGALLWTVPFLLVGYVMSVAGYLGLLRRVIAYPLMFQPYMEAMSFLAEVGIPGLVITITTAVGEFLAYRARTEGGVAVGVQTSGIALASDTTTVGDVNNVQQNK